MPWPDGWTALKPDTIEGFVRPRVTLTQPEQSAFSLFDQTADARVLKLLNIVDEHTREALEIVVERRIDADRTVATLDRLVTIRGRAPWVHPM